MTRIRRSTLMLIFLGIFPAFALGQQQPQTQPPQQGQQETEPAAAPRVIGQARTQEEFDAWQAVEQAGDIAQKSELARQFLMTYPESGLSAFAHHVLARGYYQENNIEKFVEHAELSLEELPNSPDLLTQLAFVYAESGQSSKALARAQKSLEMLQNIQMPQGLSAVDWVTQKDQLFSDSYYSIGRAYLNFFSRASENSSDQERVSDPNLQKAIDNLNKATEFDPRHEYAFFRLGFAYTNQNDVQHAMEAYARAAATNGVASKPSLEKLKQIHEFVKQNLPESAMSGVTPESLIQQQRQQLQEELAERQRKIQAEAAALEAAQAPPPAPKPENEPGRLPPPALR